MSDKIEQEAINKLTSVASALKNPFKNLEDVLYQLSKINYSSDSINEKNYKLQTNKSVIENIHVNPNGNLNTVLTELGELFRFCKNCKKGTLKDELIAGLCFECYNKIELINAENDKIVHEKNDPDLLPLLTRVDELEAQIKDIESKYHKFNSSPREYMNDVIEEILLTIRKDIETKINTIKNSFSPESKPLFSVGTIPPPPPPPPATIDQKNDDISSEVDFTQMNLEELTRFTPELLESLSIVQRNKYNSRIKELQLIEKLTPEQRQKYLEKKNYEQQQKTRFDDLRNSLKNLNNSNNPLFEKMKQKAENAVLAGKGTLGQIGTKSVYIHCHKCNRTNKIAEEENSICKYCKNPLNTR